MSLNILPISASAIPQLLAICLRLVAALGVANDLKHAVVSKSTELQLQAGKKKSRHIYDLMI
jgi:hypothetical protein